MMRGWLAPIAAMALLLTVIEVRPARGQVYNLVNLDLVNHRLAGHVDDYTHNHGEDRRLFSPVLRERRDLYVLHAAGLRPPTPIPGDPLAAHGIRRRARLRRIFGPRQARSDDPERRDAAGGRRLPRRHVRRREPDRLAPLALRQRPRRPVRGPPRPRGIALPIASVRSQPRPQGARNPRPLGRRVRRIEPSRCAAPTSSAPSPRWPRRSTSATTTSGRTAPVRTSTPSPTAGRKSTTRDEVYGVFYFGLRKSRASKYIDPVFGSGPDVNDRLKALNPADLLFNGPLRPGELAIYCHFAGRDNWNFDAHALSFAWLAASRGIDVELATIPPRDPLDPLLPREPGRRLPLPRPPPPPPHRPLGPIAGGMIRGRLERSPALRFNPIRNRRWCHRARPRSPDRGNVRSRVRRFSRREVLLDDPEFLDDRHEFGHHARIVAAEDDDTVAVDQDVRRIAADSVALGGSRRRSPGDRRRWLRRGRRVWRTPPGRGVPGSHRGLVPACGSRGRRLLEARISLGVDRSPAGRAGQGPHQIPQNSTKTNLPR